VKYPYFKRYLPISILSIVCISVVYSSFSPKDTSADMFSVLSSVFQSSSVKKLDEVSLLNKNLQNMALLHSPLVHDKSASTTQETKSLLKETSRVVGGTALTNENVATVSGQTDLFDNDIHSDRISLYTVRSGDSLEQIARMFGVNTNTILWANDLKKGTVLRPDQVLVILPITSIQHTVRSGETLKSIADKYGSDINEIAQFNSLEVSEKLTIGSVVIIPDAEGSLTLAENKRLEEEQKKKTAQTKVAVKVSSSGVNTSGYFIRPVVGGIRTQGIHGYNGVDIAGPLNTPIRASASGRVVVSRSGGWNGGYGSYVVIQHNNGTQTLYAHMNSVAVSVGQNVSQGQTIGKMGTTGRSTGVHLHFEVRGGKNPF
jgi:LysM repeat protein